MSDPLDIPLQRLAGDLLHGATRTGAGASELEGAVIDPDDDGLLEDEEFVARVERPRRSRPRAQDQSESAVTAEVLKDLNTRPGHLFRKMHQGAFAGSGQPDIYGCADGRMVVIEMKAGDAKRFAPTPKQHRALLQWQGVGALVGLASSLDQVDQIMAHLHDPHYRYNGQFGAPAPGAPPVPED